MATEDIKKVIAELMRELQKGEVQYFDNRRI